MAVATWQVALREAALKLKRMVDAVSNSALHSTARAAPRDTKARSHQDVSPVWPCRVVRPDFLFSLAPARLPIRGAANCRGAEAATGGEEKGQ